MWSSFLRLSFFSWSQILPNCMSWESKLQDFSPYLDIALHAFQETVYAYKLIPLLPLPLQENKSICQGIFSAESDWVPARISDCDVPVATESVLGWENKTILTIRPKSKVHESGPLSPRFLFCIAGTGVGWDRGCMPSNFKFRWSGLSSLVSDGSLCPFVQTNSSVT